MEYLKLEYWNDCNCGIYYKNGFHQYLYLDTNLYNPQYELDEQGFEDGNKEFHRTFAKVKKKF